MTTTIEWATEVWNPVTGCTKVSAGCKHCYAESTARRFFNRTDVDRGRVPPNMDYPPDGPRNFTDIRLHSGRLTYPMRWRKPRDVFVNSMSDLFHEEVPDHFLDQVFAVMALSPTHRFMVLTKRANRMRDYMIARPTRQQWQLAARQMGIGTDPVWIGTALDMSEDRPLRNVRLGVSVEDQATADERIPLLLETPAAVRFVSAEPLLGAVTLFEWDPVEETAWGPAVLQFPHCSPGGPWGPPEYGCDYAPGLDWVIVGGESGSQARPCDIAWVRSIVQQCKGAKVPVFVKQLGAKPTFNAIADRPPGDGVYCRMMRHSKGGDPAEWPEDLRVRQFPGACDGDVSGTERP